MATDVERLIVSMEARLSKFDKDMRKAVGIADKTAKTIETRFNKMEKSVTASGARMAKGFIAGFIGIQAVKSVVELADSYALLDARLRLVTDSEQERAALVKRLIPLANEARAGLTETANLYVRLAQSSGALGLSQNQLLTITKAVSQAIVLSGSNTQEAASAMQQFSQAIASGKLQGDEFKALGENASEIMRVLERQLGKTRGELRAMATAGTLTSDVLAKAMIDDAQNISDQFAKMPQTVGQALTVLGNSFMTFIGQQDQATGGTKVLVDAINDLSSALNSPVLLGAMANVRARMKDIGQEAIAAANLVGNFLNFAINHEQMVRDIYQSQILNREVGAGGPISALSNAFQVGLGNRQSVGRQNVPIVKQPIETINEPPALDTGGTGTGGTTTPPPNLAMEALLRDTEQAADAQQQALEDYMKKVEEAKGLTVSFVQTFAQGMLDGTSATESLSNALDELASQLANKAIEQGITALFAAFTTPAGGTNPGVNLLFGGAAPRQHGGPVVAGKPYLVGERGPELFVPRTNGAIAASGAGGQLEILLGPDLQARWLQRSAEQAGVIVRQSNRFAAEAKRHGMRAI